jgi:hypothetical protein
MALSAQGASCCGGGGASSLILPKAGADMFGLGLDVEHYDGLWRDDGHWVRDPDGSDLNQYRLNVGYAHRFSDHWQGAVNLPYVWNRNAYAGFSRNTEGVGDTTLSLLYETFDGVTCVYKVDSWRDLIPAVYVGTALTVPTGVSPYDNVQDNFDITGRGFYRLDGTVIIDKSVYPWNAGLQLTYGTHLARPVNREYGNYVEPYTKRLGDRASGSLSFGYTWFTEEMATWTATLAYADLWEGEATIDGERDPTSGLRKRSLAATVAWSSAERDWVVKGSWSHSPNENNWGENFPTTDVFSLAFSHVLR